MADYRPKFGAPGPGCSGGPEPREFSRFARGCREAENQNALTNIPIPEQDLRFDYFIFVVIEPIAICSCCVRSFSALRGKCNVAAHHL